MQKWTQLPASEKIRPLLLVVDEMTSLIAAEPMPKGVSKDNPLVAEIALRNLTKATILNNIGKIARELRFTGISLICATQVASTETGIPTELRGNLGARILLGAITTDNNRRLALNGADAVPKVPLNIAEDSEAKRGVGVYEFEGQESGVLKTYFRSTRSGYGLSISQRPSSPGHPQRRSRSTRRRSTTRSGPIGPAESSI